MKENAASKIKTLGKVGYIIATICKILAIVGVVAVLFSAVVMFVMPVDLFDLSVESDTRINFDIDSIAQMFDQKLNAESIAQINEAIENGSANASINGDKVENIELTEDGLIVETGEIPLRLNNTRIGFMLLVALVSIVMALVCIQLLCMLCKDLTTCRTPYEPNIIRRLEQLAISAIPWVAFTSISEGIINGIMTGQYDIYFNINLEVVLLVIMVFVVVYILKYGAVLQQESDETL